MKSLSKVFIIFAVVLFLSIYKINSANTIKKDIKEEAILLSQAAANTPKTRSTSSSKSVVYMTKSITPDGLDKVYKALGISAKGKVAVKISTGEPGGKNFLSPNLIKNLVQSLNATIVEANTAYGGRRANTAMHIQVAKDHGFSAIANVDIMDSTGEISLPVINGVNLKENFVGRNFTNYNFYVILSHFKGHAMGGFGGAIKNTSIGIASSGGKAFIHSGGTSRKNMWGGEQNKFLESMAEAAKSVSDSLQNGKNILYINVMNNMSVDCDCSSSPAKPDMHDIGILASLDPVALDKASVDLVYAAPDGKSLINRMESRNAYLTLTHGEKIGLGVQNYNLVNIDE